MKSSTLAVVVGAVVIAVLLIVLVVVPVKKQEQRSGVQNQNETSTTATTPAQPSGGKPPAPPGQKRTVSVSIPHPTKSVSITSPSSGERWVIGKVHVVSWTPAAQVTGGIYLADAATGQTVGWITPTTDPTQTSKDWDTQNVLLGRTNAGQKQIQPGTYVLKMMFDGPVNPTQSAPFEIIYASQATTPIYTVSIQNYAAFPKQLTINNGDTINIINSDSVSHLLRTAGSPIATIAPGESYTLHTTSFGKGPYTIYSESYPTVSFTLNVK